VSLSELAVVLQQVAFAALVLVVAVMAVVETISRLDPVVVQVMLVILMILVARHLRLRHGFGERRENRIGVWVIAMRRAEEAAYAENVWMYEVHSRR